MPRASEDTGRFNDDHVLASFAASDHQDEKHAIEQLVSQSVRFAEDTYGSAGGEARIVRSSTQTVTAVGHAVVVALWAAVASPAMASGPAVPTKAIVANATADWIEPDYRSSDRAKYGALLQRIDDLSRLEDGWDFMGAEGPTPESVSRARVLLSKLYAATLLPDRVVPSVEGGIGLVFLEEEGVADFEVLNSGETLESIVTRDRNDVSEVTLSRLPEALARIRDFRS